MFFSNNRVDDFANPFRHRRHHWESVCVDRRCLTNPQYEKSISISFTTVFACLAWHHPFGDFKEWWIDADMAFCTCVLCLFKRDTVIAPYQTQTLPVISYFDYYLLKYSWIIYRCYSWYTLVWTFNHVSLRWRHNDHAGVSNHQPHGCLLNRLFRRKSKKTSKLRVTGLCAGNSPGTGEFPAQMASYAENVSIWWRHHVYQSDSTVWGCTTRFKQLIVRTTIWPHGFRRQITSLTI